MENTKSKEKETKKKKKKKEKEKQGEEYQTKRKTRGGISYYILLELKHLLGYMETEFYAYICSTLWIKYILKISLVQAFDY